MSKFALSQKFNYFTFTKEYQTKHELKSVSRGSKIKYWRDVHGLRLPKQGCESTELQSLARNCYIQFHISYLNHWQYGTYKKFILFNYSYKSIHELYQFSFFWGSNSLAWEIQLKLTRLFQWIWTFYCKTCHLEWSRNLKLNPFWISF